MRELGSSISSAVQNPKELWKIDVQQERKWACMQEPAFQTGCIRITEVKLGCNSFLAWSTTTGNSRNPHPLAPCRLFPEEPKDFQTPISLYNLHKQQFCGKGFERTKKKTTYPVPTSSTTQYWSSALPLWQPQSTTFTSPNYGTR